MSTLILENWYFFVLALLIGIAAAWWVLVAGRRTKVDFKPQDTLDEGVGPAKRNQALIDTPPTAAMPPAPIMPFVQPAAAVQQEPAGDDLTRIKGLGPRLQALLNGLGVTSFAQIAEWDDAEAERIDSQLGQFQGRIGRDSWVEQARFLAAGDVAGYEGRFGKL
jgi:predicted flap endonuclease-1-like 5' DNA nuclease